MSGWFAIVACAGWPRWSHVEPVEATAATVDRASLIDVSWQEIAVEGDDGDVVTDPGVPAATLASGQGVVVLGALDGAGFDAALTPPEVAANACEPSARVRAPYPGDYTGDVDHVVVTLVDDATLCVDATVDRPEGGVVDLLLFRLDECGLPVALARRPNGDVIGVDSVSDTIAYARSVFAGESWLIQAAAWEPDDPTASMATELAVSAVPTLPADAVPCPLPP